MKNTLYILFFAIGLASCGSDPVARPNGYMRIGLPNNEYSELRLEGCSLKSSMNKEAKVLYKDSSNCWIDLVYPSIRSTIQLTYKPVEGNLEELFRDAQKLAYKHTVKASGMREQFFAYDSTQVYLKFWNDPVAKLYNVSSIPATFIIDDKGIILAERLRGRGLEAKIAELLD